jgi:hypothetical protein
MEPRNLDSVSPANRGLSTSRAFACVSEGKDGHGPHDARVESRVEIVEN